MLSSSRFVVAVHAMSILAQQTDKRPVCSSAIAASVHTNPVVIRRLMCALEKSQLVRSISGRCGGFVLTAEPENISLADVYNAVEDDSVFRMHKMNAECPVARKMFDTLMPLLKSAELAMSGALGNTSLKQLASGSEPAA
jgi:Rrf2 family protein